MQAALKYFLCDQDAEITSAVPMVGVAVTSRRRSGAMLYVTAKLVAIFIVDLPRTPSAF